MKLRLILVVACAGAILAAACGGAAQPGPTGEARATPVATSGAAASPMPAAPGAPQATATLAAAPLATGSARATATVGAAPLATGSARATATVGAAPRSATTATPTESPWARVPAIVDPSNHGWPRLVRDMRGHLVEILTKPQRIHTLSLGYDEITLALVEPARVVAVGTFTANETFSNVASLVADIPKIGRDAEQIVAREPDLVVASPFARADLLDLLDRAGVTVVQTDLGSSLEGHEVNTRFMAYLFGEEDRGERLIAEVQQRLGRIRAVVESRPDPERPRVMTIGRRNYTDGAGSTKGGIILAAGGRNLAAEAGIVGAQPISLEAIVELAPDYFLIGAEDREALAEILGNPSLAGTPAIANDHTLGVLNRYLITLSHWNVRGVEELAKLLWPGELGAVAFPDFAPAVP